MSVKYPLDWLLSNQRQLHEEKLAELLVTLWCLWRHRLDHRHNQSTLDPLRTHHMIRCLYRGLCGRCGPVGTGMGGLIRNSDGRCQAWFSSFTEATIDPELGEALAVRKILELARARLPNGYSGPCGSFGNIFFIAWEYFTGLYSG
ncbi:hypothetical protein M569_12927 [Genlisea aurea]|uniref:Uncharacterized protein n=1 Tax=Genlisea aurea TaxID=192259 RepID=S8CBW8_9LAMI|nr:hypothetical protein M569_12927 [Genlisea aurea]